MEPKSSSPTQPYEDLDRLKSADGIVAIISRRRSTGVLTFGIFKEFERDGVMERTSFISENLAPSWLEMAEMVVKRIAEIKAMDVRKALGR